MRELSMHEIQQVSGGHGEVLSNQSQSAGMFSHHGNRYGGYFDYFGGNPDEERPGEMPPDIPLPEEEEREKEERSCGEAVGVEVLISTLIGVPPAIGAFFAGGGLPGAGLVLGTFAYSGGIDEYRNNPNCHDDDDDN